MDFVLLASLGLALACAGDDGGSSTMTSPSTTVSSTAPTTTNSTTTTGTSPTGTATEGTSSGSTTVGPTSTTTETTDPSTTTTNTSTEPTTTTTDPTGGVECPAPGGSVCQNDNSIIVGTVRLADGLDVPDATGTVQVHLTHESLGDTQNGGVAHTHVSVANVDLNNGPVPFEIDMCNGGAMWSEDNCGFNILAILDQNGNNGFNAQLPDVGEPTALMGGIMFSCTGDGPQCVDVVLDCVDGASCAQFPDLGCNCDTQANCPDSIFMACG